MRTQSIDTHPETERVMIELIRQAPMSKRFRLVQSLTQSTLWSSIHAWKKNHREASEQEAAVHTVSCAYGATLARRIQKALERREHWQVQPIDLIAAMLPHCRLLSNCMCQRILPARLPAHCMECSNWRGISIWWLTYLNTPSFLCRLCLSRTTRWKKTRCGKQCIPARRAC